MTENGPVVIIGAGGHVGFPLSVVVADAGMEVIGVDINKDLVDRLNNGEVPYVEERAEELLGPALSSGRLRFTVELDAIETASTVIVIIGTPVDDSFNPRTDPLLRVFRENMSRFRPGQLLMMRSTVSPGTTDLVKHQIEEAQGWKEGEDFHLVFAPERVLQTRAIIEIRELPQIVGAFSDSSFDRARAFFMTFNRNQCLRLTPIEAEIGKLITNMARYVSFALANEFFLIADSFDANINRIIKANNLDYPRLDLPRPGPNVGGPCLYKDGYFLLERISFPEIISTSFKINESIPMFLLEKALAKQPIRRAGILGLTFKANCDDTRNSLSFKLRKQLRGQKIEPVEVDPYVSGFEDMGRLQGVDALFLMTPHDEFHDLAEILDLVDNPDVLIVDMWFHWPDTDRSSHNGIYSARDRVVS